MNDKKRCNEFFGTIGIIRTINNPEFRKLRVQFLKWTRNNSPDKMSQLPDESKFDFCIRKKQREALLAILNSCSDDNLYPNYSAHIRYTNTLQQLDELALSTPEAIEKCQHQQQQNQNEQKFEQMREAKREELREKRRELEEQRARKRQEEQRARKRQNEIRAKKRREREEGPPPLEDPFEQQRFARQQKRDKQRRENLEKARREKAEELENIRKTIKQKRKMEQEYKQKLDIENEALIKAEDIHQQKLSIIEIERTIENEKLEMDDDIVNLSLLNETNAHFNNLVLLENERFKKEVSQLESAIGIPQSVDMYEAMLVNISISNMFA